mmetsp:Transcript_17830/g.45372  ORF Transcript_17830/g.45372 Transcript_17830/m.45372 type:complete len:261 (-) Transcript_17830:1502-2284(-)
MYLLHRILPVTHPIGREHQLLLLHPHLVLVLLARGSLRLSVSSNRLRTSLPNWWPVFERSLRIPLLLLLRTHARLATDIDSQLEMWIHKLSSPESERLRTTTLEARGAIQPGVTPLRTRTPTTKRTTATARTVARRLEDPQHDTRNLWLSHIREVSPSRQLSVCMSALRANDFALGSILRFDRLSHMVYLDTIVRVSGSFSLDRRIYWTRTLAPMPTGPRRSSRWILRSAARSTRISSEHCQRTPCLAGPPPVLACCEGF